MRSDQQDHAPRARGTVPPAPLSSPDPTGLQRPFRLILFDWDGTAVESRQADATRLAGLLDDLLGLGVWIVVVTGTNVGHIQRQILDLITPQRRRQLIICTNRGSEVWGFDRRGSMVQRWLKAATPVEDRTLSAIAEAVRDRLIRASGLEIDIVYDRLNRRKIDLIPLPEWAEPPKSIIGQLLVAVEDRLRKGGIEGGLAEVVALTEELAADYGLPEARITSDVKHVEVGLTDKSDSVAWVGREVLQRRRLRGTDVLIGGDEFGPLAGFPGSDDLLRQGVDGAAVISVGPEPGGVPPGVIHLGGGPARFCDLLAEQVALHRAGPGAGSHPTRSAGRGAGAPQRGRSARARGGGAPSPRGRAGGGPVPTADPAWRMERQGYDPDVEHQVEARFAISNGYFGVRASLGRPTPISRPRTLVAGLFDLSAHDPHVPVLIPAPDWLRLAPYVDGEVAGLNGEDFPGYSRVLDLKQGCLWTEWHHRLADGRGLRMWSLRFVSVVERMLAVQMAQIEVDQASEAALEAWIEPPVSMIAEPSVSALTTWRTVPSGKQLAVASATALQVDRRTQTTEIRPGGGRLERWAWQASPGEVATFTRFVVMERGTDRIPGVGALSVLDRSRRAGLEALFDAHRLAWAERWTAGDIEVDGDDDSLRALRFAIYHLIAAANPDDERVSIGARALTGDAYGGHVFWDTEIFLLPFYTYTWPAAARALLMYRYHTLPAARAKARRLGHRGASYPWESADTGDEATPPYVTAHDGRVIMVRNSTDEQHITADVAYAVWQYWQATGDDDFLVNAGAEIILETARFWASRAELGDEDLRYHLRQVTGPDEYHEAVDDNAYTNVMAQWNLERALELVELLGSRWPDRWADLRARLEITDEEARQWREVAAGMETGFDPATGLLEQFDGFFDLDQILVASYGQRTASMDVILGHDGTRRSSVIKQADVVMLLALLWDRFPPEVREANFRYYEARCGHGSSLSPAVHAMVAARLGDHNRAERYFRQAADIDLNDAVGNAALGVHIAALGGLWQAAVFGYAGFAPRPDGIRLEPSLPAAWRSLRFRVHWRGRRVYVQVTSDPAVLTASLEAGDPLTVFVGDHGRELTSAQPQTIPWR